MSETAMDQTLQLYANPAMIQTTALDKLSEQVLGGEPVVDGNNVFTFLNEFNAQCTAGFATAVSKKFEALYPSRAQTFEDLYGHMSDWDYEGLYAYPSTTKIQVAFDRKFLIDNAVKCDDAVVEYRKIVLPEFSTFTIGEYKFGIHYPIEIQIRMAYIVAADGRNTEEIDYDACNITTQWDLSVENPLCSLDTNILEHRNYVSGGLTFLCIEVPVYQFVNTSHVDDAIANTGYLNKFDYDDKFYVLRVYHKQNDVWEELAQSYSSIVYDPDSATALVKVYPDLNQVTVEIPQIYFDNGLVGSQIRVDIYTTKGEMNVDISAYTKDQFGASFLLNDDRTSDSTYSDMLKYVNTCIVAPLYTKISDGNNGITLAELKRRIVDRTEKNLLITADKITSYLSGRGFTARNYVDNITGRYYLAEKVLTDDNGTIISAGSFNTVFTSTDLKNSWDSSSSTYTYTNHDTFRYIDSNSFMILPNTVYKYDEGLDTCSPMDNDWMTKIDELSTEEKITLLNSGIYSFSPFHLKISTSSGVPVAAYYDLLAPKVKNVCFQTGGENVNTNTQISMYNHSIQHLNNGVGGYVFDILLYKTDDLKDIPVLSNEGLTENIKVMLRFINTEGNYVYMYGTYMGESDEHDWMRFSLTTTYAINDANQLAFNCFTGSSDLTNIDLTQEFELLFFIEKTVFPGTMTTCTYPQGLPADLINKFYWLATQTVTLNFGEEIDNLMTNIYVESEEKSPATYPTTVFATYTDNVYYRWTQEDVDAGKTDWQGNPVTADMIGIYKYDPTITAENGLELLHNQGEVIISSEDEDLVPLSYSILQNIVKNNTSEDLQQLFAMTTEYTQTSKEDNEFVYVEYRVPEASDLNYYHVDTITDTATGSKRHKITQEMIDNKQVLYIESSKNINTDEEEKTTKGEKFRTVRVIIDALKFMFDYALDNSKKTEPIIVDTRRDLFTTIEEVVNATTGESSYVMNSPYRLAHFIFSKSIDETDYTDPEFTPTDASLGDPKMTLYRVNPAIDMDSYNTFTYYTEEGVETGFDLKALKELWEDIDTLASESEVMEKWGISQKTLSALKDIRYPFVKVVVFATTQKLKEYLEDEEHENKHGFMEMYKQIAVDPLDSEVVYKFYRYLSFKEDGTLLLDHLKCDWDEVDKWPWEMNDGTLVDMLTANYNTKLAMYMNEDTSVVISHEQGSVITDEGVASTTYEVPIEDEDADTRKLSYNVNMLHLDYKLLYSDETQHQNYRSSTVETIRSYFNIIDETRMRLLEGTNLYFSPIRTMGYAKFKGKSGEYIFCDLNLTLGFRIHAETFVSSSPSSKTQIKSNTLTIVDKRIATGTVSLVDMASDIQDTMKDMIVYVDVLGVNDDVNIQTLFRTDTSSIPHLGYRLIKNDNGSIGVERNLNLEYSVIR